MNFFDKFKKDNTMVVYGCATPRNFDKITKKNLEEDIEKELREKERKLRLDSVRVYGVATPDFFKDRRKPLEEPIEVYGTPSSSFYKEKKGYSFGTSPIVDTVLRRNQLKKKPQLENLFIEATLNCNEHCKHCGSNCGDLKLENGLTDEEIIDCLTKLKKDMIELPFITITGGEPLLRPNLINMMKTIHELGYEWGMTTNGTLITSEIAKQLKEAGLFSVSVSIDGLEETHNWFRESKRGFHYALEGVNNLVKAGIPHVMITTVVHKRNIKELDEIKKEVEATHCEMWRIINVDPIGRAANNKEILLDDEDYKYILDYIVENNSDKLPIIYSCNYFLGFDYELKVRPWAFFCEAGLSIAGIQYNGDVGACLDIERSELTKQGNIREQDLLDIWYNEFKIFRENKIEDSEKCQKCKEKHFCNGGGFHTWDFENKEPKICIFEKINNLTPKN